MQQRFEFIGFTPNPGEKHLGIAEVRVHAGITIVLRYKLVAKKDGSGCFPTCASYKMPNRSPGDEYDECFLIDSRSDDDAMRKCIMHGYHQWQQTQPTSVFASPPVAQHYQQPNPNYQQYAQPAQQTPFIQRPEYQTPPMPTMPNYSTMPEDPSLPF